MGLVVHQHTEPLSPYGIKIIIISLKHQLFDSFIQIFTKHTVTVGIVCCTEHHVVGLKQTLSLS